MNSVEARRVMAVVDDTLDGLRALSHITEEVLTGAEQLSGLVGQVRENSTHPTSPLDVPKEKRHI
ncbi:hypothetical protein ABBQ32_001588 [Trebouxia sp. C0010 RCD-2024]